MLVKLPPQRRQKQKCGKSNHKKVCKADQTQHNVTQSKRRLIDAAEILLQQLLGNWSEKNGQNIDYDNVGFLEWLKMGLLYLKDAPKYIASTYVHLRHIFIKTYYLPKNA